MRSVCAIPSGKHRERYSTLQVPTGCSVKQRVCRALSYIVIASAQSKIGDQCSKCLVDQRAIADRIPSAAFSAIMFVGALVLPPMTRGITEASTTRRPSTS
jgi:hypothetical protein